MIDGSPPFGSAARAPHHRGRAPPSARGRGWSLVGVGLLVYAFLGNYVALPGYRRYLARGASATSEADLSFVIGATKMVLWMFSFHLALACLAYAALAALGPPAKRLRRRFVAVAAVGLSLWALPSLPGPYPLFFAVCGALILVLIAALFWRLRERASVNPWTLLSYLCFALATWDVCGLGSVGRMLHPEEAARLGTAPLLVAQATKLTIELLLAWGFALLASRRGPDVTASP